MQPAAHLVEQFVPKHYDLSLDIDRTARKFHGTTTITGAYRGESDSIRLHAKALDILAVTVNGKKASFVSDGADEFTISQPGLTAGNYVIVITYDGIITDAMHGLYPSYYEDGDTKKELLVTQLESHHARELFPCVDEPVAKATFVVSLMTEPNVTVLGNMPIKLQRTENDKLLTIFEQTPRMSTYLVAFVIGELHKKTTHTKSGVEVSTWATMVQPVESLDFALESAVKILEFFEEYFDTPYPLLKCDHVAIPDFSAGAMENWGLITYREISLLANPQTTAISNKQYIAEVIAHELSHQWFGNLVTMKWWDELWLNESFATCMAYIALDAIYPEWEMWFDFTQQWGAQALERDSLDGIQPVSTPVNSPDEIEAVIDGAIVYAKGARLIRMLEHLVGASAFRHGLTQYFKVHTYRNTTSDDLWQALSEASKQNVSDLMHVWINQPGYPVVHVTKNGLSQEQFFIGSHQPSHQLWPIPLDASSPEDVPQLLETHELVMPMTPGERLNVNNTSHFVTHYSPEFFEAIIKDLKEGTVPAVGRLQLLHESIVLARGGILPSVSLINLLSAYQHETSEPVWHFVAQTVRELRKFVEDDPKAEKALRQFVGNLVRPTYERLGLQAKDDEPESDTKLRRIILNLMLYSEDEALITAAKKQVASTTLETLPPDTRSQLLQAAVRYTDDPSIVDNLLGLYRSSSASIKSDLVEALTATKDPKKIALLLRAVTDSSIVRPQDVRRWFIYLIRSTDSRAQTWQWLQDNWPWIENTFKTDMYFDSFPKHAAKWLSTPEQFAQYKVFFGPLVHVTALKRAITLGIGEIESRLELIERDGPAVREYLLNQ